MTQLGERMIRWTETSLGESVTFVFAATMVIGLQALYGWIAGGMAVALYGLAFLRGTADLDARDREP